MILRAIGGRILRRWNPASRGTRALMAWTLARWAWNRWNAPRTTVLDHRGSSVVEVTSHRDRRRAAAKVRR